MVAGQSYAEPTASNEDLTIMHPASYNFDLFIPGTSTPLDKTISWEGRINYSKLASCKSDTDCTDDNGCTKDICNVFTGQCEHVLTEDCCGNYNCELSDGEECSADCGPFTLEHPNCSTYGSSDCYEGGQGLMFDIYAFKEIEVNRIAIELFTGSNIQVSFYTAPGSSETHLQTLQLGHIWVQLAFPLLLKKIH